jgi:hypothetical protein
MILVCPTVSESMYRLLIIQKGRLASRGAFEFLARCKPGQLLAAASFRRLKLGLGGEQLTAGDR